jgi:hypothetical protein
MPGRKIICISVDLDALACYYGLYGLPAPASLQTAHYTKGLKRFLELFKEMDLRATLFAVGRDLEDAGCRAVLREAAAAGHEAASHTWSHLYDLTRLAPDRIRDEVRRAQAAIEEAAGARPRGFRAPGYHMSDAVVAVLEEEGYLYDASLLPSPPYYLAKSAVILLSLLRGRRSRSIIGGPGMVFSPSGPYRTGPSYWRRGGRLLEIPCSVATPLRIPYIGTTITLSSPRTLGLLERSIRRRDLVSLELHAIDMMDARGDGFEDLLPRQVDARVPLEEKREKIRGALARLTGPMGFEPMTLAQTAATLPIAAQGRL